MRILDGHDFDVFLRSMHRHVKDLGAIVAALCCQAKKAKTFVGAP